MGDYGSANSHGSEAGRAATGPDRSDNAEEEEEVFQEEEEEGLLPLMMPLFSFWKFRSHRVVASTSPKLIRRPRRYKGDGWCTLLYFVCSTGAFAAQFAARE